MNVDFKWMMGRKVINISFRKPESWDFDLEGGGSLSVDCPWRILKDGHIVISNEDHMQKYGLSEPINSGQAATKILVPNHIIDVQVHDGTADLIISFDQNKQLQILPISSGYESWQVNDPNGKSIIAQGGGNIVSYEK